MKTRHSSILARTIAGIALAFAGSGELDAGQAPQPPGICTRACWGARAPTCSISQMSALTRAIIHHTAGPGDYSTSLETTKVKARSIQNLHINNGWCDIAYHFLVDAGGNILEGRSGSMSSLPRGTHDCANGNSFGFNVPGYFHTPYNHAFTEAARNRLMDVIAWRMPSAWSPYGSGSYGTCEGTKTVGFLDGHRKVKATSCPGDGIYNAWITDNRNGGPIRDGINARKNGVVTPPPCVEPVIASGINADGRMALFYRGSDSGLWTQYQTAINGGWSGHFKLADNLTSVPAVASNKDGRLAVFFRATDNALWTVYQTAVNSGWAGPFRIGAYMASAPVAGRNEDGRIAIFFKGGDDALWTFYQTAPNGGWSVETKIGGFLASKPAVESNQDGRLAVFFRGGDNAMWTYYQTAINSGWAGPFRLGASFQSNPVAGRNQDGRIALFFRGGDNALWTFYQTAINGGWSVETRIGGYLTSDPAVGYNQDGRMDVFFRGSDNALWRYFQTAPNSGWSPEDRLGGYLTSAPNTSWNADRREAVFFRGSNNSIWHRWQTAINAGWSGELNLGGLVATPEYR